jgi:hypothetical protein
VRTQSVDTHPDVERVLITLLRQASKQKRFQTVQALTGNGIWANVHIWMQHVPGTCEQDAAVHYVASAYGNHLAQLVQEWLAQRDHWQLQPIDLLAVVKPILSVLASAGIPYYLGGSLASSLQGMQQLAQDIDLIVDLQGKKMSPIVAALKQSYAIDEQAALHNASVSLIHLDTLMKIDIIVSRRTPFDLAMARLIEMHQLDERYTAFPVASAVEMILWKLMRYQEDKMSRNDGMEDDAIWNDILGMLKVQGPLLNKPLLEQWAKMLAVGKVLERAFWDAGLSG